MSDTCHQHSESESPWMCACTRDTLDASRRMVETRDVLIADLHRKIQELKKMLNGAPDPSWHYQG